MYICICLQCNSFPCIDVYMYLLAILSPVLMYICTACNSFPCIDVYMYLLANLSPVLMYICICLHFFSKNALQNRMRVLVCKSTMQEQITPSKYHHFVILQKQIESFSCVKLLIKHFVNSVCIFLHFLTL